MAKLWEIKKNIDAKVKEGALELTYLDSDSKSIDDLLEIVLDAMEGLL